MKRNWTTELTRIANSSNSIVAYNFFGLDELARQLEQPFGLEPQCLALNAICRTIEISASEAVNGISPAPLVPGPRYNLL